MRNTMYKRIVIKVGTSVLASSGGYLDAAVLKSIVDQIAVLKKRGIEIVLVTSGAIGVGRSMLKLSQNVQGVGKQILAAVGQVKLMSLYAESFKTHSLLSAQVLVTKEDFRDRAHYMNMKNCLLGLLRGNVIPVVNENDVVATTELYFTDNDELAGLVASQLDADAVIILTSVDGVFAEDRNGKRSVVAEIDTDSFDVASQFITAEKSAFGRGGMLTKFGIAKKLVLQGIAVYIENGKTKDIILDVVRGKNIGTKFIPSKKSSSVKRRIAYSEGLVKGAIFVNECTEKMLFAQDKIMSLLPIGVTKVVGDFEKGDTIEIKNKQGKTLGFGVAQCAATSARASIGKKNMKPVIHYNYMYING